MSTEEDTSSSVSVDPLFNLDFGSELGESIASSLMNPDNEFVSPGGFSILGEYGPIDSHPLNDNIVKLDSPLDQMPPAKRARTSSVTPYEKLTMNIYASSLRELERRLKLIRQDLAQGKYQLLLEDLRNIRHYVETFASEFELLKSNQYLPLRLMGSLLNMENFLMDVLAPQLSLYEMDYQQLVGNFVGGQENYRPINEKEVNSSAGGDGEKKKRPRSRTKKEAVGSSRPDIPVRLSIIEQGSSGPVFKDKILGPIKLKLLTGAVVTEIQCGPVMPDLVDTTPRIKQQNSELESSKQGFQENGTVNFSELKFSSGTFPSLVRIKFEVAVQLVMHGRRITCTVNSAPSKPYISMTNTGSQWKDAAGLWLKRECFGSKNEITLPRLWNYMQRHYMINTKQDVAPQVKRPFYVKDFSYLISAKFPEGMEKRVLTLEEYQKLWDWIGPIFKRIRYQKHLLWLFLEGYLCGFITGKEAEVALKNEKSGSFLIRISERLSGEFVISYNLKSQVRHYLIQPTDTSDKKKTLVDFLGQKKIFMYILQMKTEDDGTHKFQSFDKDGILQKYYKKPKKVVSKEPIISSNPYDTRLPIPDEDPKKDAE